MRDKIVMPERPSDQPPVARLRSDRERAEAARLREIARKAPPLPDTPRPFPAEPPLKAGLAELAGLWLEVRCRCGHVAYPPLRLMAAERGWRTPLSGVLPRLRCRRCSAAPHSIDLIADPADGEIGSPGKAGPRLRLLRGPTCPQEQSRDLPHLCLLTARQRPAMRSPLVLRSA